MSSFPKMESAFGSIFWNRELWRFKMQRGSWGFTAFSAMEFAVEIKCSEGFGWGLGEGRIRPLCWHHGSWLLSNQCFKTVAMLFLEGSRWERPSLYCSKKGRGKKSQTNPWRVFGFGVAGKLCVLCVPTSWPCKIDHLYFPCFIFQGEKKTPQPLIEGLSHEKGSRRCLIYAVMSNFGHGTSESYFPPPSF